MQNKIPKWESRFWSYLSKGDGMHCPLYSRCPLRKSDKGWCADDNREIFTRLLDSDISYDSLNYSCLKYAGNNSWGLFKFVEKLANTQLNRAKVRSVPVPTELVFQVDEQHPIEVQLLPIKSCHGVLWRKRGWVIQLRADDSPAVRRLTLFHEAFHILAHSRTTPVFRKRGIQRGSYNEMLADYFAICILMPRKEMREKWSEINDLDVMTGAFDVPKSAMLFRLTELGLI